MSEFPPAQLQGIINLFLAFNEYYPAAVLEHRLALFKEHLNETHFAWIGEFGNEDPYYYRIHSPVAFMELDFHCGSKFLLFFPTSSMVDTDSIPDQHKSGSLSHSYHE